MHASPSTAMHTLTCCGQCRQNAELQRQLDTKEPAEGIIERLQAEGGALDAQLAELREVVATQEATSAAEQELRTRVSNITPACCGRLTHPIEAASAGLCHLEVRLALSIKSWALPQSAVERPLIEAPVFIG